MSNKTPVRKEHKPRKSPVSKQGKPRSSMFNEESPGQKARKPNPEVLWLVRKVPVKKQDKYGKRGLVSKQQLSNKYIVSKTKSRSL